MSKLFRKDLIETLSSYWGGVDRRYKYAFFTALVINVLVYLVFIVHQPMHNHGILSRLLYTSPYEQLPAGRWFSVVIFHIFNSANLMVLLPLVTIIVHILGGMLTVYLWDKRSSVTTMTAGALLVSLYPAVMTSFNFSFVGPIFSGPHVLAPLALLAASSRKVSSIALGSILVCIMMATYQPGLSIILTIFMAYVVVIVFLFQGGVSEGRELISQKILPKVIAIAVGGVLYRLSLPLFGIEISQTTSTVALSDIPEKFLLTAIKSFDYLNITQPEILRPVKATLLIISLSAFAYICYTAYTASSSRKYAIKKALLLFVMFIFLIMATKGMYYVSANENYWTYRYNHALGYFYMFGFFVLLQYAKPGFFKNIIYLVLIFVLVQFSYANIGRQQVLLRAQDHHLAIANRILYRIESLPGIDYEKTYRVVRVGSFSNFQHEMLKAKGHSYRRGGDVHLDSELSPIWGAGDIFNYLGSKVKLQGYMNSSFQEDIEVAKKLVDGKKPWPSQESVFIHGDMIIVYI